MSYFQRHNKISSAVEMDNFQVGSKSTSYVRNFKKTKQNHSRVSDLPSEAMRPSRGKENEQLIGRNKSEIGRKSYESYKPGDSSLKDSLKQRGREPDSKLTNKYAQGQQKRPLGLCLRQQDDLMLQNYADSSLSMQNVMIETESMDELLNSSIKQFEKYFDSKDNIQSQNYILVQQNQCLKNALNKLKLIIKEKLESALKKQKDELSKMLQEYIKMITKLLSEKEQFTVGMQDLQDKMQAKEEQFKQLLESYDKLSQKLEMTRSEKDKYVHETKKQVNQFLQVIEQYEGEAQEDIKENENLKARVAMLEQQLNRKLAHDYLNDTEQINPKLAAQTSKVQTLLELLERTQEENNALKEEIHSLRADRQGSCDGVSNVSTNESKIESYYRCKMQEMLAEHEEEFMEYEKAVKETMSKKDEAIERLNIVIEGLRAKINTKELGGSLREVLVDSHLH